eukprot:2834318-Rhodomonas_salina.1
MAQRKVRHGSLHAEKVAQMSEQAHASTRKTAANASKRAAHHFAVQAGRSSIKGLEHVLDGSRTNALC